MKRSIGQGIRKKVVRRIVVERVSGVKVLDKGRVDGEVRRSLVVASMEEAKEKRTDCSGEQ